jgi:glutathione S-transferase
MKLYTNPRAASPRRVAHFLREKGLEIPTVVVDLAAGEQLSEAYLRKNPAGTVPLLELDDGTCLAETVAICRYLELTHPEPPLFGTSAREQALVEMWQRRVELEGLLPCFDLYRNRNSSFEGRGRAGWNAGMPIIPALADRTPILLRRLVGWLAAPLAEALYLAGDRFSIADITLWITLTVADRLGVDVGELSAPVQAWRERVLARPATQP